jgi:MSHA biogenesis protein MshJ
MVSIGFWLEQFESRDLRDRLLLSAVSVALLGLLAYPFWIGPLLSERQVWSHKLHKLEQESARIARQSARVESRLQQHHTRDNRLRLQQLEALSAQLDQQLGRLRMGMIRPERVPEVLQDMLRDLPLVLLSLRKLPPSIEIDSAVAELPKIYRHQLRLELEGSYQDTLDYIERLESLPWGLAWEALDIRMQRYPKAKIVLQVYTLSFEQEWLGV